MPRLRSAGRRRAASACQCGEHIPACWTALHTHVNVRHTSAHDLDEEALQPTRHCTIVRSTRSISSSSRRSRPSWQAPCSCPHIPCHDRHGKANPAPLTRSPPTIYHHHACSPCSGTRSPPTPLVLFLLITALQPYSSSYFHSASGTSLYLMLVGCLCRAGNTLRMYRSPTLNGSWFAFSPAGMKLSST